jgi:hypothetical protein
MERKCADMPFRKKKSLVEQALDQASDVVDAARPVIESAVTTVREQVRELSKDTQAKAAPLVAEGRSRAAELASDLAETTRDVAIPAAKASAIAGAGKAAELAASGKELASAKLAEVKGEPQKKKGGKLRKVLLFGSLAALAGFVVSKLRGNQQADNWQSSYTPPTSTTPPSSTTSSTTGSTTGSTSGVPTTGGTHLAPGVGPDQPVGSDDPMTARADVADDSAGASPDEALADAVEEPHEATTPDDPAEVVDVEPTNKKS